MGSYALEGLFGGIGQGLNSYMALKMALEDREQRKQERESEEAARRLSEIASRAKLDEMGVRFGERPQENNTVRLPDPNVIKGSGLLTPDMERMGEPSFRAPLSLGQEPRMEAPPGIGMRGSAAPDLMGILRDAVNRPQGPSAEIAPRYRDLPGAGAYVDTNATERANNLTDNETKARTGAEEWDRREGIRHENELGQIRERGRQYRSRPLSSRTPAPPSPKSREDHLTEIAQSAVDAAGGDLQKAIALVDQSPDKALFGQGLSSRHFQAAVERYNVERATGRYRPKGAGNPVQDLLQEFRDSQGAPTPQAPTASPEGEDVLPPDYIEEAANDPEYAEFLRQNGYDPATGRRIR